MSQAYNTPVEYWLSMRLKELADWLDASAELSAEIRAKSSH